MTLINMTTMTVDGVTDVGEWYIPKEATIVPPASSSTEQRACSSGRRLTKRSPLSQQVSSFDSGVTLLRYEPVGRRADT